MISETQNAPETSGGAAVVAIPEQNGVAAAAAVRREVLELLKGPAQDITLDCRQVPSVGTSLLQVMLATEGVLARRGRSLRLAGAGQGLRQCLEVAGMKGWFLECPVPPAASGGAQAHE